MRRPTDVGTLPGRNGEGGDQQPAVEAAEGLAKFTFASRTAKRLSSDITEFARTQDRMIPTRMIFYERYSTIAKHNELVNSLQISVLPANRAAVQQSSFAKRGPTHASLAAVAHHNHWPSNTLRSLGGL